VNAPLALRAALVTGGGTGIGRAIALALGGAGAAVAVNYSRSRADAEDTAQTIRSRGGRAIAVQADVSIENDVERLVRRVAGEFGRLDILVNNAGTTAFIDYRALDALDAATWDRIFAVNVKGAFFCARAASRVMAEGRILNIGSVAGITGKGSSIAYASSKGALHTMTKSLARTLAPRITVNAIAPGVIDTPWHRGREGQIARVVQSFPIPRAGRPEDIAHIALALVAANSYITGQVIVVDGGMLL
jgi:3-oxoacyl-[acyl-carrier protein] reductase